MPEQLYPTGNKVLRFDTALASAPAVHVGNFANTVWWLAAHPTSSDLLYAGVGHAIYKVSALCLLSTLRRLVLVRSIL